MGSVMSSPVAPAPLSQGQTNGLLTKRQEQTTDLQSHNQLFPQQAAAAPPSQNEAGQSVPNSVSQTVTVTSAPVALQTEEAVVSASAFNVGGAAQAKSGRALLPSRRFAASTISNGSRPSLSIQPAISSSAKMPAKAGNGLHTSGRGNLSKSAWSRQLPRHNRFRERPCPPARWHLQTAEQPRQPRFHREPASSSVPTPVPSGLALMD
jgi:hypothetical protein